MRRISILLILVMLLTGCNTVISENTNNNEATELSFKESEMDASYSLNGSTYINLADEDVYIKNAGTYILEGTLNGSVVVEVSKTQDVQLVLNNVVINSGDFAGIYIVEGDEITITLADGSTNSISDNSSYTQIDSNDVDALIYSKADLIINGTGILNLNSDYHHGIVSKDDLTIISGEYNVDVAGQGLRGKDCVKIKDGVFNITSSKDAIKSANSEDEARGYIYIDGGTYVINTGADGIYAYNLLQIEDGDFTINTNTSNSADSYKALKAESELVINGGSFNIDTADDGIHCNNNIMITNGNFTINSSDDAIHADGKIEIDDGTYLINAREGIEATYVLINDGDININGIDDGINAGQKVNDYTPTIEINGGNITDVMAQGDTDAIDSNGYIYVNGGTIDINAQSAFDFDLGSEYNGGTIIVNGTQVDQITSQMMTGGGFGQRRENTGQFTPGENPGAMSDNQFNKGSKFEKRDSNMQFNTNQRPERNIENNNPNYYPNSRDNEQNNNYKEA